MNVTSAQKRFSLEKVAQMLVALAFAVLVVYRLVIVFSYAPEVVNGETNNIWNALKVSRGLPIYTDPEHMPLEIFQYSPLSQLPSIVTAKVYDQDDSERIHRIMVVGRLCSLLFNVITVFLLYASSRLLLPVAKGTLVIGCFLAFSSLTHLAFAIRPDAMALMLMMLGFYLFSLFYATGRQGMLVASAMVLATAFFAKQDAMVAIAPLSLLLLVQQRWKQLLIYDGVFLLTLCALLLAGNLFLGEFFLRSVVNGVGNQAGWWWARDVLPRLFSFYGLQVVMGNLAIVVGLLRSRTNTQALPIVFAALFYELFAFLASFKVGSGMSYFTPFLLFSTVLIVVLVTELVQREVPAFRSLVLVGVLALSASLVYRQAFHYTSPFLKYAESRSEYLQRWSLVVRLREELKLSREDRLLAPDPLTRLMLSANSVMPNTEFYGISPFRYDSIRQCELKPLEYMLLLQQDTFVAKAMMDFFYIDKNQYIPHSTRTDYLVLARRDLVQDEK
jgi:hypothetical protein